MAKMPTNGERNPETPEELWEATYIHPELRTEFEAGDESAKNFVHDHLYLNKMMNEMLDELDQDNSWHNSAFEFIATDLSQTAVTTLIKEGPHAFREVLEGLFSTALAAGYRAGEGPEHIKKCRCKPAPEEDPAKGIGNYL